MSSKNNKQQMLQAAVAVNTALNAADCFGFLPVRGTKLNISGNAKVGCLETDEILLADNKEKALVIKEGNNAYMTISTKDSAEKVNIHEDTKMDKNLQLTGTLNAGASTLASASVTGALSAAAAVFGSVSSTGAVSGATVSATGAISAGTTVSGQNIPQNISSYWRTDSSFAQDRYEPGLDSSTSKTNILGDDSQKGASAVDTQALFKISEYLAGKTSLTAAESKKMFGSSSGVESQTATITLAAAGALAGADGFETSFTPQFLTGDISAVANIGAVNAFLDPAADGVRHLIIFGGNKFESIQTITFTLTGLHDWKKEGCNVITTDANGKLSYTDICAADGRVSLTIAPSAAGVRIEAGSFLYIENDTGANTAVLKGYLKATGGTLTLGTA